MTGWIGLPVSAFIGYGRIDCRMDPGGLRDMVEGFDKNFVTAAGEGRWPWMLAVLLWLSGLFRAAWCLPAALLDWINLIFPIPVLFFLGVFLLAILNLKRGRVPWKGRFFHPGLMAMPSWLTPVGATAAFWLLASLLIGGLANRLPDRVLRSPPLPVRRSGAGVRHWKRWIPDAGGALPGGVRKASLVRRDPQALRRLVLETRRAELVHWALWPAWIPAALWLPPLGVLINLVFATLFNLPCLLLQRHNRSRLQRCLGRMAAKSGATGSAPDCGTRIESGRCTGL